MKHSRRSVEPVGGISAEQSAEISLVPLVDLCLTLVVVFLILIPMSMTSLIPISGSETQGATQAPETPKELPLLVNLDADSVRVSGVSLQSDLQVVAWFRDAFGSRKNHDLVLQTALEVKQDRLVHWLDTVRTTGDWVVTLSVPGGT
jgi:biopolymer transport protein ExbD